MKSLDFVANIRSVAIVGATKKNNYFFVRIFAESFRGKVYAIHPELKNIEGFPNLPVYGRVTDIPRNEPVDFVFISLPREKVVQIIDDCVEKHVKLVSIFTTNFADEGTEEGCRLQSELIEHAKNQVRIIGPNGMGLYYPRLGIRWRSSLPIEIGSTGIVAQSGGFSNLLIHGLTSENVKVSKAFSIGNAADINALDVLNYFKDDPETNLIIAYIEGLPEGQGHELLRIMKDCKKPLLMIKGGRSKSGSRAAMTHTASLVGNYTIWKDAVHQGCGILLRSFDDILNIAKYIKMIGPQPIHNLALISLSGGYGVVCTDMLADYGIQLPLIEGTLSDTLSHLFTIPGTSFKNPLDIAVMLYEIEKLDQAIRAILSDSRFDGLLFEIAPLYIAYPMRPGVKLDDLLFGLLKKIRETFKKPIGVIIEDIGFPEIKNALKTRLQAIDIPVFNDIEPFARSIHAVNEFVKNPRT